MNQITNPLNRQIELEIYGVPEWKAGQAGAQKTVIVADGSSDNFRIRFDVRKQMPATSAPSTIRIYNLSRELRSVLRDRRIHVVLRAGWKNTGIKDIFTGSILSCTSERDGADIVTTITSLSGWGGLSRAAMRKSFNVGATLTSVVKAIASDIEGVTVEDKWIKVKDVNLGKAGYAFDKQASEVLDDLARVYGFSWTITDGVFKAIGDKFYFPPRHTISTKNGYLLRCEPMLATPLQRRIGTSISSLLLPEVGVGESVQLESDLNPQLNGAHKIYVLGHSGDSHSNQWNTSIESYQVGGPS